MAEDRETGLGSLVGQHPGVVRTQPSEVFETSQSASGVVSDF